MLSLRSLNAATCTALRPSVHLSLRPPRPALQFWMLGSSCPSSLGPGQWPRTRSLRSRTEVGQRTGLPQAKGPRGTGLEVGTGRLSPRPSSWECGEGPGPALLAQGTARGVWGVGACSSCRQTFRNTALGWAQPLSVQHREMDFVLSGPVSFSVLTAGCMWLHVD